MRLINDLSKESKVFNIRTDGGGGGGGVRKYLGGAKRKVKTPLMIPSAERECGGILVTTVLIVFLIGASYPCLFCCCFLILAERSIPAIYHLLRVRNQVLNARKERGGFEDCEIIMSREENVKSETSTIISSFLEQVDFVLKSSKFLFYPLTIREVKRVRQEIKCLYDLLKDIKELDNRENVWMGWVREICLPANEFLTSFVSKRQQQKKRWAKLKAPTFLHADLELKTKMMVVRRRIQYAYGRR